MVVMRHRYIGQLLGLVTTSQRKSMLGWLYQIGFGQTFWRGVWCRNGVTCFESVTSLSRFRFRFVVVRLQSILAVDWWAAWNVGNIILIDAAFHPYNDTPQGFSFQNWHVANFSGGCCVLFSKLPDRAKTSGHFSDYFDHFTL